MRFRHYLVLPAAMLCLYAAAGADVLKDVPAGHWARSAVQVVTRRGVMSAPGGRFNGSRAVTRTELAVALASLARALEKGDWPKTGARPLPKEPVGLALDQQNVTRYELAYIMDRTARYAVQGLPKRTGKTFGASDALPAAFTPKGLASSNPARESLTYMAKNRMIWPGSPLLNSGQQPVTGAQTANAVAQMILGLNDRLTDEPQNREQPGKPPHKH